MKSFTARAAATQHATTHSARLGLGLGLHQQQRLLSRSVLRSNFANNERCCTSVFAAAPLTASNERHYAQTFAATSGRTKYIAGAAAALCGSALAFAGSLAPNKQEETMKEEIPTAVASQKEDLHETVGSTIVPSRFPLASMFTVHADEKTQGTYSIPESIARKAFPLQGQANVYKIVLTGGPCGGKSTALSILSHRLTSLGFRVYSVPEAATILFTGGGRFAEWDMEKEIAFEESKIRTQMALEDGFMQLARVSGKPSVVICDRGTVDSKAYIGDDAWNLLLNKTGWSIVGLRDKQYDAVLHLISAALGAESFYQTVNNPTRTESLSGAKELDLRILNAWIGHPRLYIIDNSTDFKGKMDRVMEVLCRQLGIMSSGTVRKFLLRNPKDFDNIPVQYEEFDVEQTFLRQSSPGTTGTTQEAGYVFIQKRGQHGINSYRYSTKLLFPDTQEKAVIERQITGVEYLTLLKQADPARHVVKKKVRCFLWNHRYYELSSFVDNSSTSSSTPLVVLYTDGPSTEGVKLPPFLSVSEDVTADRRYSSYTLAAKEQEATPAVTPAAAST